MKKHQMMSIFPRWHCSFNNSFIVLRIFFLVQLYFLDGRASISCESDLQCQRLYNSPSTTCLLGTKTCSNPFQQGCLRTLIENTGSPYANLLPTDVERRVCSSDDFRTTSEAKPRKCQVSPFDYPEIRIHNGNWESSMVISWIYQILLSELLQVPATVGLTAKDTPMASFYSEQNEFVFSKVAYPYDALEVANRVGSEEFEGELGLMRRKDCSYVKKACVDILPEVWSGQASEYAPLIKRQVIEHPSANGLIGRLGIYLPRKTVQEFPEFSIWFGLAGDENRRRLAEIFLRPISWKEYCDTVDPTNCQERYPAGDEEGLYYEEGLFEGYFSAGGSNNCTQNPDTCAGHIVTPPCSWSSPLDAQLFWNNITGLTREGGTLSPVSGYTSDQIVQIYRAANATGSHVILLWYKPEPAFFEFRGTDYEFVPITLPSVTEECKANQPDADDRCSSDPEVRRGSSSLGSCGNDIEPLQRLAVRALRDYAESQPDVHRSSAHGFLERIEINNLELSEIIKDWRRRNVDPTGNDARAAVCSWVASNIFALKELIPEGYPRTLTQRGNYDAWYAIAARILAGAVALVAIYGFLAVSKHRKTKTMIFAQPLFLNIILIGFFLTAIGALFTTTEPSVEHCVASTWLLVIGYTLELVPVLVKTAKINHLVRSYSKTQQRVQIKRQVMLFQVSAMILIVVAFLIAWTIIDPPHPYETRSLKSRREDVSQESVESNLRCSSDNNLWRLTAFAWNALLLILAAFLAFQSRGVMAQLNESKSLGVMVYSHFLFVIIRGVCNVFFIQETFAPSVTATLLSLSYSVDVFVAMVIYILPKILKARESPGSYKPGVLGSQRSTSDYGNYEDKDGDTATLPIASNLSILVCSGNLGNKEPTIDSLRAWIPPDGAKNDVKRLEGSNWDDSSRDGHSDGCFGIIAIGMQEATWTNAVKTSSIISPGTQKEISEAEVLNALEEANTVRLREMIQDVLGENYYQVTDERRGQMRLHLWATAQVARSITEIQISGANTGIGNVLANKGGIAATACFDKTRVSFVTAHLAAHEGDSYYKARCDNIESILNEAKTFDDLTSVRLEVTAVSHHTFFLGDLNFRTRFPGDMAKEEKLKKVNEMIDRGDLLQLYELDELKKGLEEEDFLVGFKTLRCTFAPTFKVERQKGLVYKDQRVPSWTDRILFHSSPGLEERLRQLSYEACTDFATSDHKPIRGAFSLSHGEDFLSLDSATTLEFQKIRCSRLEGPTSNAMSNVYVTILWDNVSLISENFAAFDFLRAFWSGRKTWPRTSSISKSANPSWKGESVSLALEDAEVVGIHSRLFIAVMQPQRHFGRHEVIGLCAINVKDVLSAALANPPEIDEYTETFLFDIEQRLLHNCKCSGHIKFRLKVSRPHRQAASGNEGHARNSQRRRSTLLRGMSRRMFLTTAAHDESEEWGGEEGAMESGP